MSNYGRMLEQGRGTDANPQEAARWFDLAARQGQPEAQWITSASCTRAATACSRLRYGGRSLVQARRAAQQQTDALARLGHLYRTGQVGVQGTRHDSALRGCHARLHPRHEGTEDMAGLLRFTPRSSAFRPAPGHRHQARHA